MTPVPERDETEAVVENLDHTAGTSAVMRALARLSDPDRDCVVLYAWGQLTYEEIAVYHPLPIFTCPASC